jgi:hypothetical protein
MLGIRWEGLRETLRIAGLRTGARRGLGLIESFLRAAATLVAVDLGFFELGMLINDNIPDIEEQ